MKRLTLTTSLILTTLASTAILAHAQYTAYDLGTISLYPEAINDARTIVGWGYIVGDIATHAVSYSNGYMTDLGPGQAYGINDAGTIVGQSYITSRAFSYSAGVMTDLGVLGQAFAINSAGTIVGKNYSPSVQAFSYSAGAVTDLGTLGGLYPFSCAFAINSAGTIVGFSSTSGDGASHAFSHSGGQMTDLGTLGGTDSGAYGISSGGTIVGRSKISGDTAYHAFSYSDGEMSDLTPCLASIGLTGDSNATAVNENGDIVGYGATADGQSHVFLLAQVPEPSTVALLALGGTAWLLRRRGAR